VNKFENAEKRYERDFEAMTINGFQSNKDHQ
jgi:hypothetical protein